MLTIVVTGTAALQIIEPVMPAHRGYVRATEDQIRQQLAARLIVAQLDINRERRSRLLDEAKQRELELQSDQAKATPQYRAIVQDRVNRIKEELDGLSASDKSLFDEQKAGTR
jgi:hypothetical protein